MPAKSSDVTRGAALLDNSEHAAYDAPVHAPTMSPYVIFCLRYLELSMVSNRRRTQRVAGYGHQSHVEGARPVHARSTATESQAHNLLCTHRLPPRRGAPPVVTQRQGVNGRHEQGNTITTCQAKHGSRLARARTTTRSLRPQSTCGNQCTHATTPTTQLPARIGQVQCCVLRRSTGPTERCRRHSYACPSCFALLDSIY